jgi:P4 family phage/plasmid primase-like protien
MSEICSAVLSVFSPDGIAKAAIRAKNPDSKGRTGYYPVIACGKRFSAECRIKKGVKSPCKDCPENKGVDAVDLKKIASNMNGNPQRLGIYPLLPDGTSYFGAFDIDAHKPEDKPEDVLRAVLLVADENEIPVSVFRSGGGKGFHVYFFYKTPVKAGKTLVFLQEILTRSGVNIPVEIFPKQERLKDLGNLIALPFHGKSFRDGGSCWIDSITLEKVGDSVADNAENFIESIERVPESKIDEILTEWGVSISVTPGNYVFGKSSAQLDKLFDCKFFSFIRDNPDKQTYDQWRAMIQTLRYIPGGLSLIHKLSAGYPGYSAADTDAKIKDCDDLAPCSCKAIKLVFPQCKMDCGVKSPKGLLYENRATIPDVAAGIIDLPKAETSGCIPFPNELSGNYPFTDLGNAERLTSRHCDKLRYSFEAGEFLFWTGKIWTLARHGEAHTLGKETIRSIPEWNLEALKKSFATAGTDQEKTAIVKKIKKEEAAEKFAFNSEKSTRFNSMMNLAKSEKEMIISLDDFDKGKWLFNCSNGTLDLRNGDLKPHSREDYLTKLSPVNYDSGAQSPVWEKFLSEVFGGDDDLIAFMQRSVGYAMTGDTSQECFWIMYGTGGNGKGTFIKTVSAVLSEYAKTASFPLLCTPSSRQSDMALNQLAFLKGSRFVAASEGEENAVMSESNIKNAVAPDDGKIMARFKYQNLFSFEPEFKIWLASNYKPIIKGTDDGIWRRVMAIPFNQKFKGEKNDTSLKTKLSTELPGVLNWMLSGCLKYQETGLCPPDAVRLASEAYRNEMDWVSAFTGECCVISPVAKVPCADLYKKYLEWHDGRDFEKKTSFNKKIEERGFTRKRGSGNKMCFFGIGIVDEFENNTTVDDSEDFNP